MATFPDGFNVSGASVLESDFSFDGAFEASADETASTVTITRSRVQPCGLPEQFFGLTSLLVPEVML